MPSAHTVLERRAASKEPLEALQSQLVKGFGSRNYSIQYAPLYDFRLKFLRRRVAKRCESRWSGLYSGGASQGPSSSAASTSDTPEFVPRILDIQQGQVCYVIGTIYMSMPLKPDVLDDLTREHWLAPQPARTKFFDAERDEIFVEDESGRVQLVGPMLAALRGSVVTGVTVGVLGTETREGDFEVADLCFADLPPPSACSTKDEIFEASSAGATNGDGDEEGDKWVAVLSGLEVGGDTAAMDVRLQLLVELLTGELGSDEDRQSNASIVSVIIAGNSLAQPVRSNSSEKPKRYGYDGSSYSAKPTLALDQLLTDLSSSVDVHLLPGDKDPASVALPQQAIHSALFPRASRFASLAFTTNPAWIGVGGRKLLGTSGQNVDDIYKYLDASDDSRLDMASNTLRWSHMAPTAPDTLWCYPFSDRDPFLIQESPDVYFIGNQTHYDHGLYNGPENQHTRVILIPRFAENGEVVLLNLRTLETKCLRVEVDV